MSDRYAPKLVKPVELPPSFEALLAEKLFEAGPEKLDQIVRQTRNFAILHEASKRMQREHDPKEMLARVLDLILEVTSATRGYVALLDETGELRVGVTRSRGPQPSTPQHGITISQTVSEHVLQGRCAVICSDAAEDERFQDAASLFLSDIRSLMAVPILVSDRVRGLIEVESSHMQARFTENDLDLLSVIASTVGVSLDNLELAEKREHTIRELEQAQARLLETQDRLVKSEQMAAIGRLATGIAHEVKNHLGPFMLADMIAKKYRDDQQIQDAAEMMVEAQQHILDLVNEIRNFVSGSDTEYRLEPQDLCEVVERVIRFMHCDKVVKKADVSVVLDDDRPLVALDSKGFRQVLINLIRNAADALPDKGGKITIRVKRHGERAFLDVADNGRGIPENVQAHIFEPFFSTKGDKGLGLGLDISKKIIEAHGGQLDFRSAPDKGTTFRIALPVLE